MMTNKNSIGKKDWQKVDARVLGQILAAQNIDFVLPDINHIAEFFVETLNTIPGITSCRVCLEDVSVQREKWDSKICEECQASRKRAAGQDEISPFLPGLDFTCGLGDQPGMYLNVVASRHHHFGYFIFQVSDPDVFNVYIPFIGNLANYVALSLENRLQRDLLQKSQIELERKVEERTQDLQRVNAQLQEEIEIKRQAEDALQHEQALLSRIMETSPVGITLVDREGQITFANSQAEKVLGLTRDEITQRTYNAPDWHITTYNGDPFPEEDLPFQQVISTGRPVHDIRHMVSWPDGHRLFLSINGAPIFNEKNNVDSVVFTVEDITKRRQAEEALRESEQKFRSFVESSSEGFTLVDEQGTIIEWNPAREKMTGLPASQVIGQKLWDVQYQMVLPKLQTSEFYERFKQTLLNALQTGQSSIFDQAMETEVMHPHRSSQFIRQTIFPIKTDKGYRIGSVTSDITERKRAQDELRTSETRFRAFVDHAADAFFLHDERGNILDVNQQACKSLGYSRDELIRMSPLDFDVGADRDRPITDLVESQLDAGETVAFETLHRRKDGSLFPVEVRARPFWQDERRFSVSLARDISERKQAERALQESEERLRQITSSLREVIWLRDAQTRQVLYVNPAFEELTGRTCESFYKNRDIVIDIIHPDDKDDVIEALEQRFEGVPYDKEHRIVHLDGSLRWVSSQIFPVRNDTGDVYRWASIMEDITERKQAEVQLLASEQLFRALVENSPDFIARYDLEYRRIYVNPAIQKLFASSVENVLGETPVNQSPIYAPQVYIEHLQLVIKTAAESILETPFRTAQGEMHWGHIRFIPEFGPEGKVASVLAIGRDIHEIKENEQRFRMLAENFPDFVIRFDCNARCTYVNPTVENTLGMPAGAIIGKTLQELPYFNTPEQNDALLALILRTFNEGIPNATETHWNTETGERTFDIRYIPEKDATGNVISVLSIIREITERRQHEREREVIITVSTALRQAVTRTEILNIILDQLIDLFDADGAVLVLPDPHTGGLVDEMGRGVIGERMVGLNIPPGKGICNWVITNKKPYLSNRVDQDTLFYRPDLLGKSHCLISIPLIAQEQVTGALWIARQLDFVEQDLRLLTAIADIAANAIHRITLHEQTEQQLHRLIALHQIDLAISTNIDLNITLNVILDSVKDELEVDAVSILLINPITHTLDYTAGIGFRTRNIEQSHVRLGSGCAGRAAQELRTISGLDIGEGSGIFVRSSLLASEEFMSHYATPLVVKGLIKGVLEVFHRKPLEPEHTWFSYFETLATQSAIAIENASLFENLQRSNMELTLAYDATIEGWSRALDLRDRETEGHTQRVAEMALELADKMGVNDVEKLDLWRGALLHDIGKMGVPDAILLKPGPLSNEEWEIMRQHPLYAYEMLSPIKYLKHALEIPYCHHEKWDGSGYPRGLKGNEIPLSARVFAVIDVFDALISDRPYSKPWPREKAYQYIRDQADKHFDPQVVKIFLETQ